MIKFILKIVLFLVVGAVGIYLLQLVFIYILYSGVKAPPTLPGKPKKIEEMLPLLDEFWKPGRGQETFKALPVLLAIESPIFVFRNNMVHEWHLNDLNTPLASEFRQAGVDDPQAMAAATAILYHRYLNHQPLEKEKLLTEFANGTLHLDEYHKVHSNAPEYQYDFQEVLRRHYYPGRKVKVTETALQEGKNYWENPKTADALAQIISTEPSGKLHLKIISIQTPPGYYTAKKPGDTFSLSYNVVKLTKE